MCAITASTKPLPKDKRPKHKRCRGKDPFEVAKHVFCCGPLRNFRGGELDRHNAGKALALLCLDNDQTSGVWRTPKHTRFGRLFKPVAADFCDPRRTAMIRGYPIGWRLVFGRTFAEDDPRCRRPKRGYAPLRPVCDGSNRAGACAHANRPWQARRPPRHRRAVRGSGPVRRRHR